MGKYSATINEAGITAPSYAEILTGLQDDFRGIYGSDIYIEPDSQDGQFIALLASAINDANDSAIAVYNAFSPSRAVGAGLSSLVKLNGLRRLGASNSTANVKIVGQVGTLITNGVAQDALGNKWALPASVVIPGAGEITVTATAVTPGAITAPAGSINKIATPTLGWQSVTNLTAATPGAPVESDAILRRRQTVSTALPALSVLDSIVAAVANLEGVRRYAAYENDDNVIDANGLPPHSISLVVEGGDVQEIGATIANKKTPGTGTYGTTAVTVVDPKGIPNTVNYFELAEVTIKVEIDITALVGYVVTTGDALVDAVAAMLSESAIGADVLLSKLYTAANLKGSSLGETYDVTAIRIARDANPPAAVNVAIAFNEAAVCTRADITLTVT